MTKKKTTSKKKTNKRKEDKQSKKETIAKKKNAAKEAEKVVVEKKSSEKGVVSEKSSVEKEEHDNYTNPSPAFANMPSKEELEQRIKEWNEKYPIGTKCKSDLRPEIVTTRTKAQLLFGHRLAVYMEDYNGYFDLEELTPIEE